MPRGRMLNKKVCFDEEVAKLSLKSALIFTFCIPNLDREGKILADLHYLKGNIVPYRKDFSIKDIQKCLDELGQSSLVIVYGNGHKYMKFLGFDKNQSIRTDRESPSEIPNPTPAELQHHSNPTPAKIPLKLNISKVKLSKDSAEAQEKPVFNENPLKKETKDLMAEVYKQGFNIYSLLGKLHKDRGYWLPEQVITKICAYYTQNKAKIEDEWAWFIISAKKASEEYFAQQNIAEGEAWKRSPVALSLKDIISGGR